MDGTQLPRLDLPSGGGWVEFNDLDDLTGRDLHEMRKAVRAEDAGGETANKLWTSIATKMVKTWDIPYLADPRTPEANPAWWKALKLRDLRAIETAVQPVMTLIQQDVPGADDGSPGSPPRPESE